MMERGGRDVALDLMRMALALLDREGEALAAARLQGAIDCVDLDGTNAPLVQSAVADDDRM